MEDVYGSQHPVAIVIPVFCLVFVITGSRLSVRVHCISYRDWATRGFQLKRRGAEPSGGDASRGLVDVVDLISVGWSAVP